MKGFGRFGPLVGAISVGNTYCKFLVYASKNAEILTCHEIKIKQISRESCWLEFDPVEIWHSVRECIEISCRNLNILDINHLDIVAIGLCNQRGTTVLWNKRTGTPLHNAIAWCDCRTSSTLKEILHKVKGKQNYLKSVCGLPLSSCFSALKIKWLIDNIAVVNKTICQNECLFGTLDTWIFWNLTGGPNGGVHVTDVTNAAYTMLMNLTTLNWDKRLCDFFNVPMEILPEIRSCSEIYAFLQDGELRGTPLSSCLSDQSAALLGQLGLRVGQSSCTLDESCHILINTGKEIIDSENGLISTVAFKLGKENVIYALEGAISNAGSAVSWLKDNLEIHVEINQNDTTAEVLSSFLGESSMISSSNSSAIFTNGDPSYGSKKSDIIFVPAFNGLYSPYWKDDARGLILGLSSVTTVEHLTQGAYESTGFQIRDVLESFSKDTPMWKQLKRLTVGGEFSENNSFMQFIADIVGVSLERPQTTSPACLGVMLAAGKAMDVLSLERAHILYSPPLDFFYPTTTANRREILYQKWQYAIKKSFSWKEYVIDDDIDDDIKKLIKEEEDPLVKVQQSIPGSIFLTTSFALLIIAHYLKNCNIS